MKRKLLALVLSICMLCSVCPMTAFAAGDDVTAPVVTGVSMNAPGATVKVGDTLYFDVYIEDESQIASMNLHFQMLGDDSSVVLKNTRLTSFVSYNMETGVARAKLKIADDMPIATWYLHAITAEDYYGNTKHFYADDGVAGFEQITFAVENTGDDVAAPVVTKVTMSEDYSVVAVGDVLYFDVYIEDESQIASMNLHFQMLGDDSSVVLKNTRLTSFVSYNMETGVARAKLKIADDMPSATWYLHAITVEDIYDNSKHFYVKDGVIGFDQVTFVVDGNSDDVTDPEVTGVSMCGDYEVVTVGDVLYFDVYIEDESRITNMNLHFQILGDTSSVALKNTRLTSFVSYNQETGVARAKLEINDNMPSAIWYLHVITVEDYYGNQDHFYADDGVAGFDAVRFAVARTTTLPTSVSIPDKITVAADDVYTIRPDVEPITSIPEWTWTSSDTGIAEIHSSDDGRTANVIGIAPGVATITGVTSNGLKVFCEVTVTGPSILASGYCGGEDDGTNLLWTLTADGKLTIKGTGAMADYYATTTPWYGYEEYISTLVIKPGVTSIGDYAFNGCSGLTDASIPDSVTDLGSGSFGDCRGLTELTLPDSVTTIGENAFNGCTGLTSIAIPNSLTVIEEYVFFGCSGLTEVTIPNSVMTIEDSAFADCEQLSGVVIPESVTSIGDFAFDQCAAMQSVTIPDSVASIGRGAFRDCSSMQSISVSSGNLNYCDKDGVLFNKDRTVVVAYPAGKTDETYEIPAGVTTIGELAFIHSVNLTSITIPNGVTSIGESSFAGCYGLTSITIPDGVTSIGAAAFCDCFVLTTVTIPDSVAEIAWAAFLGDDGLSTVYYGGTEEQWNAIAIDTENDPLLNATIICLKEEEDGTIVIISAAFGADIFTTDAGIETYSLPVEVIYRSDASFSFLSEVPVILSVEGVKADMSYSENGYEYDWDGFFFSRAYFTRGEEHDILTLVGINDGLNDCVIHAGDYAITITIPAEYMENGQALTLDVLLEVIPTEDNYVDLDSLAVSLKAHNWTVAQEIANTEEAVKAWIEDQIHTIGLNGAEFALTMTSFVPAEAGTKADPDGTNGSFAFSVVLNADNGVPCTEMTVSITTGIITATAYVPTEYTVTYDANGGTGTVPAAETVTEGGICTIAGQGKLYRNNYDFTGWNTKADGTGTSYAPGDKLTITCDITLYAQWTESQDSLNLKALIAALEAFDWTVAQETANTEETVKAWIEQQIAGMELYGKGFRVDMIAVTPAVAGELSDLDGTNGSFAFEVAIGKVDKAGHWTQEIGRVTITTGIITATACVLAEYTVTYDANGGTGTVPSSITEAEGTVITVAERGNLKNGDYEFVGWNTEKNGTGIAYQSGAQMTLKSDVTLYAQWRVSNRTVSGTITGHKGVTYVSVTAKLVGTDGVEYTGTVGEGVPDGKKTQYAYSVNAPEGKYTLIVVAVTDEGVEVTRTHNVNLKNKDATQHVNLPNGQAKAKSEVVVEQDAPQVLVGGLDDIVDETVAEDETVTEVEVTLVVEAVDETTPEAEEICEQAESEGLEFVELTIRKDVKKKSGETESENLSELNNTVDLVISFDCEGRKDIKVYRYHGDQVDTLTTTPNADGEFIELGGDHIVIHAKKFSTYAIGYNNKSDSDEPEAPVTEYTIIFDSNGGSGEMDSVVVAENAGYKLPDCGFTAPERKEFLCWNVNGVTHNAGDTITVTENITISAVWQEMEQEPEQPEEPSEPENPDVPEEPEHPEGPEIPEIPVIPDVPVYSVTIAENVAGGQIAVSTASATKGTVVTITATPDVGYELDTIAVIDHSGNTVALTDKGDGKFTFVMPVGSITITAIFKKTNVQWINPFEDVEAGAWYYDAVAYVAQNGLMNGYDIDTFGVYDTLTRAQLTQILYNLEGRPEVSGSSEFSDVADGEWYTDAVIWASANGIIGGYGDGRFGPNDPVTREQMATILYRYEQSKGGGFQGMWMFLLDYSDREAVSEWAYEAVCWMTMNGIINGMGDGTINPGGQATRAQIAQILMKFLTID